MGYPSTGPMRPSVIGSEITASDWIWLRITDRLRVQWLIWLKQLPESTQTHISQRDLNVLNIWSIPPSIKQLWNSAVNRRRKSPFQLFPRFDWTARLSPFNPQIGMMTTMLAFPKCQFKNLGVRIFIPLLIAILQPCWSDASPSSILFWATTLLQKTTYLSLAFSQCCSSEVELFSWISISKTIALLAMFRSWLLLLVVSNYCHYIPPLILHVVRLSATAPSSFPVAFISHLPHPFSAISNSHFMILLLPFQNSFKIVTTSNLFFIHATFFPQPQHHTRLPM